MLEVEVTVRSMINHVHLFVFTKYNVFLNQKVYNKFICVFFFFVHQNHSHLSFPFDFRDNLG